MPLLVVYGEPVNKASRHNNGGLRRFSDALTEEVAAIGALDLSASQVSCVFPALLCEGRPDEIFIFVEGLFDKPERTPEVRKRLAENLVKVTREFFPHKLIECFIRPFNPELGFATTLK